MEPGTSKSTKFYGLVIDLNLADSIDDAVTFKSEEMFEDFVKGIRELLKDKDDSQIVEVGIKEKDGTVSDYSFEEYRKLITIK